MEIEKGSKESECFNKNTNKPVAIVKLNGKIDDANDAFYTFFGVAKHNAICKIIAGPSLKRWHQSLREVNREKNLTFNLEVIAKIQSIYSATVELRFCEKKQKIKVLFDLSLQAKERVENYNAIVCKDSDMLMMVASIDGTIESINHLTDEYFGLARDYFIGSTCEEFFTLLLGDYERYLEFREKVMNEGYGEVIQPYKKLDGDARYYKVISYFDKFNELFLVRVMDYTEKTLLKEDLVHQVSLSEMGQLAASIAHEIRNPITTLKGFTQLLKESATEESIKYLTVIDDEILRIESILNEMLFLSKPNAMEKKSICPEKLLADIIYLIYPKATYEGIEIIKNSNLEADTFIYGDEGKLKQVLLNLLKNALESMKPNGVITVSLIKRGSDQLNIIIEDTGKGMTDIQLEQIFSPYFTTRENGTGLGLPFVIKTIENHGGTITVSSEINIGTRFVLTFPLEKELEVVQLQEEASLYVN